MTEQLTYSYTVAIQEADMGNNDITFERYKKGYQDGYEGRDPEVTTSAGYLQGYAAGFEDDLLGKEHRFPEDE